MILMSKYRGKHGGKKGQKIRARPYPPPPLFRQCPKENGFSYKKTDPGWVGGFLIWKFIFYVYFLAVENRHANGLSNCFVGHNIMRFVESFDYNESLSPKWKSCRNISKLQIPKFCESYLCKRLQRELRLEPSHESATERIAQGRRQKTNTQFSPTTAASKEWRTESRECIFAMGRKEMSLRRRTRCTRCTTTSPAWSARWWAGWGERRSCVGRTWTRGRRGLMLLLPDLLLIRLWVTISLFCWQKSILNPVKVCLRASLQVYIMSNIFAFTLSIIKYIMRVYWFFNNTLKVIIGWWYWGAAWSYCTIVWLEMFVWSQRLSLFFLSPNQPQLIMFLRIHSFHFSIDFQHIGTHDKIITTTQLFKQHQNVLSLKIPLTVKIRNWVLEHGSSTGRMKHRPIFSD